MNDNSFFQKNVKIIVVLAVIASSSSGIFVNLINASPMTIGFWRLGLAVPVFAVPAFTKHREDLKAVSKKDLLLSALAGAFLFGHFLSWFNAVKMTDIASAVTLGALHPLVVLIISILVFKQRVGVRPILGIVLALLGGAMIAGFDYRNLNAENFMGDMLAILAAVFMGLYFAVGNDARKRVQGSVCVFLVFLTCFICFSIGMVITGTPALGYAPRDYGLLVALTLICQIGAHAVFNLCIGYVDSLYVSTWETGECFFSIILGVIILKQIPTQYQILGAIIVVIGLLYYNFSISKQSSIKP